MASGTPARLCLLFLSSGSLTLVGAFRESFRHDLGEHMTVAALGSQQVGHSKNSQLSSGIDLNVVVQVMQVGIEGVQEGITSFEGDSFDLEASLRIFDEKLWKIIELVVPAEQQKSPDFAKAREAWDSAFKWVPGITTSIMKYRETGDTSALTEAMNPIFETALNKCAEAFPEVAAYFQAVQELIDGIFDSWGMFSRGETAEAVEQVWNSVKKALKDILPEITDANAQMVMDSIDGVISKLSAHVLDYKRRILNSKVCYKRTERRTRVRPSVCREGFEWDQMNLCRPKAAGGAPCWETCGREAGMCPSFCGKGKACCQRDLKSDPPECVAATGYVDHDFTKGSSKDYHQCVTPGPALQYELQGGGEPLANGLWVQNGKHSGKPRYTHVNDKHTIMEWSNSRKAWRLFIDRTTFGVNRETLYQNLADSPLLPTTGWEIGRGLYPVPRIKEYDSSTSESLLQENATARWFGGDEFGAHESMCDETSDYPEKNGLWCYGACDGGYIPKGESTCEQVCGGTFPAEGSMGVCGHNPGELAAATAEMLSILANSAVKFVDIANQVKKDGVKAEHLSGTVNTFIELGKPFARPWCPEDMSSQP